MRRLLPLGFAAAMLLAATPARATAEFPGIIVQHLAIKCDGGASPIWDGSGCTICHTSNGGGLGTVQHPFGAGLKSDGLGPFLDGELTTLLDQEKTAQHDFNCDGIPDIDQLESCNWPDLITKGNACDGGSSGGGDAGAAIVENVIYGCSTAPAPAASRESNVLPASVGVGLAGLLLTALVRRRRKQA